MALAAVCLELSGVGGQCLTGSRSFPSQCLFIDDDGNGNCVDGAGEIFANLSVGKCNCVVKITKGNTYRCRMIRTG